MLRRLFRKVTPKSGPEQVQEHIAKAQELAASLEASAQKCLDKANANTKMVQKLNEDSAHQLKHHEIGRNVAVMISAAATN